MAMAYVVVVNPQILSAAGMPADGVLFAACLSAALATLTFSIATRLSLGLRSFTFRKVASGRYKEIRPLIWILSVLFLCRDAFPGSE